MRKLSCLPLFAMAFLYAPDAARAELKICNKTQHTIALAIGKFERGKWHSDGWYYARPQDCALVIKSPLTARFYYLHGVHLGVDGGWDGNRGFCVRQQNFSIEGRTDCEKHGHRRAGFFEIDTNEEKNWTTFLSD